MRGSKIYTCAAAEHENAHSALCIYQAAHPCMGSLRCKKFFASTSHPALRVDRAIVSGWPLRTC